MPKRLSRQRMEEIREEVKAISRGDRSRHPKLGAVRKTLSCEPAVINFRLGTPRSSTVSTGILRV